MIDFMKQLKKYHFYVSRVRTCMYIRIRIKKIKYCKKIETHESSKTFFSYENY